MDTSTKLLALLPDFILWLESLPIFFRSHIFLLEFVFDKYSLVKLPNVNIWRNVKISFISYFIY